MVTSANTLSLIFTCEKSIKGMEKKQVSVIIFKKAVTLFLTNVIKKTGPRYLLIKNGLIIYIEGFSG
jgi:hypothetical protein